MKKLKKEIVKWVWISIKWTKKKNKIENEFNNLKKEKII